MALYYKEKEMAVIEEFPFFSPLYWESEDLHIILDGVLADCGTRVYVVREPIEECIIKNAIVIGHSFATEFIT